jgi:hypothetical protein
MYVVFSFLLFFLLTVGCENITENPVTDQSSSDSPQSLSKVTLPAGSVVESAVFHIYVRAETDQVVDIHQVTSEWAENEVTWVNRLADVPWNTAGGDFTTHLGSFLVEDLGWHTVDITSLVNAWLGGTPNYGILLKQDAGDTRYWSSEYNDDPSLRPKLVVNYNVNGTLNTVVVQRQVSGDVFDSILDERFPDFNNGTLEGLFSRVENDFNKRTIILFDLDQEPGFDNPGTGTPGYWKNHPQAWPVNEITVGGVTYTKDQAISLLKTPGKGDKTYTLFMHLVCAKLNVISGNDDSCIAESIDNADNWMAVNGPVGSGVAARTSAWQSISGISDLLDDYNNGFLCAPHRD